MSIMSGCSNESHFPQIFRFATLFSVSPSTLNIFLGTEDTWWKWKKRDRWIPS